METLKNNKLLAKSSTEFPCSYIKGNLERRIYINISSPLKEDQIVSDLTRKGFRRNYNHMYIPNCRNCNSCISSRINIQKFIFTKSNKRNLKNNDDLFLINNNDYTKKRFHLFKKYCRARHADGQMKNMSEGEFVNFFHNSINKTEIYDLVDNNGYLYGSILLDVIEEGYSAVYSFFDPKLNKRSLGKNMILKVITKLKEVKSSFLYLGYWVKESENMNYKSSFNNVEYFVDGNWKNIVS